MVGGKRFRPVTLAALCLLLGAGIVQAVREWRDLWAERHVALSVTEVVRLRGDRAVVVLTDRSNGRRLPIPMTLQDGTAIERRLQSGTRHSLTARSLEALGARIVRVAIDVDPAGGLSGKLIVSRGVLDDRELPLETGEAIRLALDEGAPIETSRDLLEVAGISEEEARTLALDSARGRVPEASSLPVHTF
jgi:bifunctional DNase/RNase